MNFDGITPTKIQSNPTVRIDFVEIEWGDVLRELSKR